MQAVSILSAGKALLEAINTNKLGFVARVNIVPGQADAANSAALLRRALSKRHGTKQRLDYTQAVAARNTDYDRGQIASDRRGVLAELLVADMLHAADAPGLAVQPLVDYAPQPGIDIRVAGKAYDVKAAGQTSAAWSHQGARGRFNDDNYININNEGHVKYLADADFAGYICVYVYVENEQPAAADVFIFSKDNLGQRYAGTISNGFNDKDMRFYRLAFKFPDDLHYVNSTARASIAAAAYAAGNQEQRLAA